MTAWPAIVVGAYGVFTLVGGIIGYVKAKSQASLMAGVASGAFLLICAIGMSRGNRAAALGSALVALSLGVRFFGTWRKNHRVMPDGLMLIGSVLTLTAVLGWLAAP